MTKKVPAVLVAGYVVQEEENTNIFLSRSMSFLKRRDRKGRLGIERAFVHSVDELLKEKDGIPSSARFYYACFNPDVGFTGVSCYLPIDLEEFLNIYEPTPVP
jgi:hypothetical protein